MRTYPLVSIACCTFMLVARDVYDGDAAEARVMYGISLAWDSLVVVRL